MDDNANGTRQLILESDIQIQISLLNDRKGNPWRYSTSNRKIVNLFLYFVLENGRASGQCLRWALLKTSITRQSPFKAGDCLVCAKLHCISTGGVQFPVSLSIQITYIKMVKVEWCCIMASRMCGGADQSNKHHLW